MQVSRNVIDAEEWANESSLSERGRIGRRDTLKRLLKTNGKATFVELFEDIRTDKVTVYSACKKFVDTMRKDGLKPSVVYVHRSRLPELFQSVLGEENFSKTVFNRLVPKGDSYVTTRKAIPTWEQVKYMLKISTPQYRCLIASLATAGWRIMEALTRKMSDLDSRKGLRPNQATSKRD
ncbi:hypothetical protein E6H31_01400 [Candidatus Bathyarchaeota archaeon]|nr:MAG: hypothetical protein E6H31_01400 [Candidatus Bathyarchaeota archaeon]